MLGKSEEKEKFRKLLGDLGQKYPLMGEVPKFYVRRVQELLDAAAQVEPSADVKVRAATRAMEKWAPCHRPKNSINDAVLIEMYADALKGGSEEDQFVFVSKNYHDFSAPGQSRKTPHPDIVDLFQYPKSHYLIALPEALELVAPEELEEANYQASGLPEARTFTEIGDAIDLLVDQVWYNRYKMYEEKIHDKRITLVDVKFNPRDLTTESKAVWKMAQDAAKRMEQRRALENLGPWTDFEWGMLNGKLSALRWVLGDEWDLLDT